MKQKFRKLERVHVCSAKNHYESDFDGIVNGTYSQLYSGKDIKSYDIYVLNKKGNKIINCISWYDESLLSRCKYQNKDEAEEMIEKFNFRNTDDE